MVEAEWRIKLERCLLALEASLSVSLVVRDDVEMIDRRFAKPRNMPPSSISSPPLVSSLSLSSSPDDEELEEVGAGGDTTTPVEPIEVMDGGEGNKAMSGP